MVTLDMGDMISKVGAAGREYGWATFTAGFVYGVTNDINYGGTATQAVGQRVTDTIARISGYQTSLGGLSQKSSQSQSFNPGNILNMATYAAVGLELLHSAWPNKWTKLGKDVLQPPFAGYAIGKVFDDPYMPNIPGTQPNLPTTSNWQGV
jgi:hypothetical protein